MTTALIVCVLAGGLLALWVWLWLRWQREERDRAPAPPAATAPLTHAGIDQGTVVAVDANGQLVPATAGRTPIGIVMSGPSEPGGRYSVMLTDVAGHNMQEIEFVPDDPVPDARLSLMTADYLSRQVEAFVLAVRETRPLPGGEDSYEVLRDALSRWLSRNFLCVAMTGANVQSMVRQASDVINSVADDLQHERLVPPLGRPYGPSERARAAAEERLRQEILRGLTRLRHYGTAREDHDVQGGYDGGQAQEGQRHRDAPTQWGNPRAG